MSGGSADPAASALPPVLDVYASLPHFWRHLRPVVDELRARGHEVRVRSRDGDFAPALRVGDPQRAGLTMVANWDDAQMFADKPVIYVEHGAGQTYRLSGEADGRGYSGAPGLDHVRLFIAPGEPTARRWRERYPQAVVKAVGCPALDVHSNKQAGSHDDGSLRRPVIAFASHWRCSVCPETMPALPHYEPVLEDVCGALTAAGTDIVGHAHPRGYGAARKLWTRLGVPYEPDPDVVLATASLLVVDNSSLAYEAAALDIPVLTLSAPWYRRDVEHGLRFWSHVPGIHCTGPEALLSCIDDALHDGGEPRALRHRAAAHVYADVDGHAAARAADAVEELL